MNTCQVSGDEIAGSCDFVRGRFHTHTPRGQAVLNDELRSYAWICADDESIYVGTRGKLRDCYKYGSDDGLRPEHVWTKNGGTLSPVTVESHTSPFDEDDYARVTLRFKLGDTVLDTVSYRIDGRA